MSIERRLTTHPHPPPPTGRCAGQDRFEVSDDEMTEVEFRESVKDSDRREKVRHAYRDARTGREVLLQDAGKPWTVKGERRQTMVCVCA